jgi:hypothetical protein
MCAPHRDRDVGLQSGRSRETARGSASVIEVLVDDIDRLARGFKT